MPQSDNKHDRKHAVLVTLPLVGHVNPMLQLAEKLACRGVKVTFINTLYSKLSSRVYSHPNSGTYLQRCTCGYSVDHIHNGDITMVFISDGSPTDDTARSSINLLQQLQVMETCYARHFEEEVMSGFNGVDDVTCVIGNMFVRGLYRSAKKRGIPFYQFWPQSAASYASIMAVARGAVTAEKRADGFDIPGLNFRLGFDEMNGFLRCFDEEDFMFRFFTVPFVDDLRHADAVLINTFDELEHDTLAFLNSNYKPSLVPVGPLLPHHYFGHCSSENHNHIPAAVAPADADHNVGCIRWLDQQPASSVLYVSFGTLAHMPAVQLNEIAAGLESSGVRFLWVVRAGLVVGTSNSGADDVLPEGFISRTQNRGLVVPWAPQLRVLRHSAVAGFFSHCGWNSTLEGLSSGVPILAWCSPFSDQSLNAKFVADVWKFGIVVGLPDAAASGRVLCRSDVEKNVRQLLDSPELAARARELGHGAFLSAGQPHGSSHKNLDKLIG